MRLPLVRMLPRTSVKGYEFFEGYFICENGEIWSKKRPDSPKIISQHLVHNYPTVRIINKFKVLRTLSPGKIVASAFIENPTKSKLVRYKDGNPSNCNVDNLEWIIKHPRRKKRKVIKRKPRPKKRGPKPKPLNKKTRVRVRTRYYVRKNSIVVGSMICNKIESIKKALAIKAGQEIDSETLIDEILETALNEYIDRRGLKRIIYQLNES